MNHKNRKNMKKIQYLFLLPAMAGCLLMACNNDSLYENEMYKHAFGIVSNTDDYNIRSVTHDLDKADDLAYITLSLGGTNPSDRDLVVTLREDEEPWMYYNKNNFNIDVARYVPLLPSKHYRIDNLTVTIPAGGKSANLPIRIWPEGLSPDSMYFISMKVDRFSAYEVNPDKADVLYRPLLKNFWCTQGETVPYRLRSKRDGIDLIGNKILYPLKYNQVRATVGDVIVFDIDNILSDNMILEVAKEQGEKLLLNKDQPVMYPVSILPYGDVTILPPRQTLPANVPELEDDDSRVRVSPVIAHVRAGQQLDFSATVFIDEETIETEVTWSVNSAISTIDPTTGRLTVLTTEAAEELTVTATSVTDGSLIGTATVKVYPVIVPEGWEYADPDYPNVFFIEWDGFRTFKTFLLHYRYQRPDDENIHEMREELRIEFVYDESK
jgi:hypothetical protein